MLEHTSDSHTRRKLYKLWCCWVALRARRPVLTRTQTDSCKGRERRTPRLYGRQAELNLIEARQHVTEVSSIEGVEKGDVVIARRKV